MLGMNDNERLDGEKAASFAAKVVNVMTDVI